MARWMKRSWLTSRMMLWGRGEAPGCVSRACVAPSWHAGLPPSRLPALPAPSRLAPGGQWLLPPGTPPQQAAPSKPELPGGDLGCVLGRPFSGPAPGEVVGQLVQPPRVGLGGLHQVHLPARREESTHLLQQWRPGPVQAGSQALGLLRREGLGGTPRPLTPHTRDPRGHALQAKQRPAVPAALPGGDPLTSLAWSTSCRNFETKARLSLAACRVALRVALSRDSSCFRRWRRRGVSRVTG